jgi:CRP-like cAMP-binding protein
MYFLSKGSANVLSPTEPATPAPGESGTGNSGGNGGTSGTSGTGGKVIHVITSGFFGEISCFFDEPRSATVVAGHPACEVMVLTREDLDEVLVRWVAQAPGQ